MGNINEVKFCNEGFDKEQVCKLINEYVIDWDVQSVYQYFIDQFDMVSTPNQILAPEATFLRGLNSEILNNSRLFGVDIPIWFGDYTKGYKIMIVGIDPLRNEAVFKDFNRDGVNVTENKNVIIGTPYALHSSYMRNKKTQVYWKFIEKLAENSFVYLTDIYKHYFFNIQENIRSYKYFEKNDLNKAHIDFLKKEIELIIPTHIITFGGMTKNFLYNNEFVNSLKSTVIIPFLHPAARSENWKSQFRKNGIDCSATVNNKVSYMNDVVEKEMNKLAN